MSKYIRVKKKYLKSRKYSGKCEICGIKTPDNLVFSYDDDSNASISYYSPYCCYDCYHKKYGEYPTSLRNYLINLGFKVEIDATNKTININDITFDLKGLTKNKVINYFKNKDQTT